MKLSIAHIMNSRYQIGNHYEFGDIGDVSYIQIPRCGSTAIRQAIELLGQNGSLHDYKFSIKPAAQDEVLFTVIRDPFDRWASGCSLYIIMNGGKDDVYDEIKGGRLVFDEHTLPMSDFLKGFSDIKYFAFSNNVIAEINSYYNLQLESKIVNVTEHQYGVMKSLLAISKTKEFQQNFQKIYKDDIQLWDQLQKT